MAPKKRINREDIISVAFQLIKSEGIESLNARNLAKRLGCSTQPVFSEFNTMEELKQELFEQAGYYFLEYLERATSSYNQLYSFGLAFIDFVQKERNFYQLIFMSGALNNINILDVCKANYNLVTNLAEHYSLSFRNTEKMFIQLLLYLQGIAAVLYSNEEAFQTEEIKEYLKDACEAFLEAYKEK
ncbi:TetR/AcrR family transcriptional regulator [Cytobacillus purgationiresistens]|uniref:AcrR family transcriptional regulator n=1 Tax=Cytobacillus purgationiresistens TaxID=863449 RepID=A0ABU0AM98_9BACI|nr:TetR/AcrR family transcriptional regulator [Cytobacillus purgationiresistens]MDQ0271175.1 AcrR family transcriptional regulator [Cytobacillus purgationiresistens]